MKLQLPNKIQDERGATGIISVVIITPIFIGILILMFVASSTTQTDNNLASAAQNAARSASFCCDSAAEAAVVAHNVAASIISENGLPCRNFGASASGVEDTFVTVNFYGPQVVAAGVVTTDYEFIKSVDDPRSKYSPKELREELQDDLGDDALKPGGVIQVVVSCRLPLENITGFWLPFRKQTTRTGSFNAVVDPLISIASS